MNTVAGGARSASPRAVFTMSLKIIGGEFGGRTLKSVRGLGTRPLLGQVRESLFNIIGDSIDGAIVWDLFAGTGASGIEALSRGAGRVLFCEKNGRAIDVLKQNLDLLGEDAVRRSKVLRTDAWDPPVMHRGEFGATRAELEPDPEDEDAADESPADESTEDDNTSESPAVIPTAETPSDEASDAEVAPDIVFLDPPYSMVAEDPAKSMGRARRLLDRTATGGCVIFHFETGALDHRTRAAQCRERADASGGVIGAC